MQDLPGVTAESKDLSEALYGFTASFLAARFDEPKAIPDFHSEWWSLFFTEYQQVTLAAPRGHAKSTAITFAYALFILLFKMSKHLLILGANEALASAFLNDIKIELQENDALTKQFGVKKFLKDSETELIVLFDDGHKFRIKCKGAGQRMRGLKWERKRPDTVIFDDLEDDETVLNEARRDKFRRWFFGALKPIIRSGGKIRGVGTIIGFDSLLERMMPGEKDKDTVHEPLRTYSTNTDSQTLAVLYRAHDADFSHVLWTDQYSEKALKLIRAEYAKNGMLDIYGQEYLNDPIDETVAYYRKADFLDMTDEHKAMRMVNYSASDFAIGESKKSAYSVIITGGMTPDGFLNIVDVRRGRWDGKEINDELFSVDTRYSPEAIRIEDENIAKAIGAYLYLEMDERHHYLPIDTKPATQDKSKRSRSIQAMCRAGRVRFDKEAEWWPDFQEELLRYPKYPYKDQFDAFGSLGQILAQMISGATDEEVEDDEYETMLEDNSDDGRDEYTGY